MLAGAEGEHAALPVRSAASLDEPSVAMLNRGNDIGIDDSRFEDDFFPEYCQRQVCVRE